MSAVAILNPRSSNGKIMETWNRVRSHLSGPIEVLETNAPGHAIELTRSALRHGAKTVIVVGGDGTINEVANGFFDGDAPIAPETALGIIPHGTGSDLRRSLKLPLNDKQAADVIRAGATRMIDVASVEYTGNDGRRAQRYSINLTSFGMGGTVAARANKSSKAFGGKAAFLSATLRTTLEYGGRQVTLKLDGSKTITAKIMNVAVGNGQFHGGGMWICPRAKIDDGLLDVTIVRHLRLPTLLYNLPILYNGRIYEHPGVEFHSARQVEATAEADTFIEIDGEPLGKLPLQISILPKAIRVLTNE